MDKIGTRDKYTWFGYILTLELNTVTGQIWARDKNTFIGLTNGYKDILYGEGIEI
jgi:hypothetical protein